MKLINEIISSEENPTVIVIFGGNPLRRHEILSLLQDIGNITAYAALSEEEGIDLLGTHRPDIVLIGGRYTAEQRRQIKSYIINSLPNTKISEPGYDYHYSNDNIRQSILSLMV